MIYKDPLKNSVNGRHSNIKVFFAKVIVIVPHSHQIFNLRVQVNIHTNVPEKNQKCKQQFVHGDSDMAQSNQRNNLHLIRI
jgi:hypothetical protein